MFKEYGITSECDEEIIDEFTDFLPSSFTVEGEGEGELR